MSELVGQRHDQQRGYALVYVGGDKLIRLNADNPIDAALMAREVAEETARWTGLNPPYNVVEVRRESTIVSVVE